jgi:hypothetical protein
LQRNKYDKKDCLEVGLAAEESFKEIALREGWSVQDSSRYQNMNDHVDVIISKPDEVLNVDVKGLRRRSRWDDEFELEWTWIEYHGVRQNDIGWLFGGKADLFAFEHINYFIIITRDNLQTLARTLVKSGSMAQKAADAKYRPYSRPGRHDIIAMIETQHIIDNAWAIWEK